MTTINNFLNLPAEMKKIDNWILWRLENRSSGKPAKVPYCARGGIAKVNAPNTFATFEEAVNACQTGGYDGIGFVFDNTSFVGIDIDGCYDADGTLSDNATQAFQLAQSYTEISQSGKGLHIIMKGTLPPGERRNTTTGFEMYAHGSARYFAMTGNTGGAPISIREDQSVINEIHARFVAKPIPEPTVLPIPPEPPVSSEPSQEVLVGVRTDEDYLNVGLSKDKSFACLYHGERPHGNESSDDLALMNKLAYWCNANKALMWDAFHASGHFAQKDSAHLDKCRRSDYLQGTVEKAASSLRSIARIDDEAWREKNGIFEVIENFENGDAGENERFNSLLTFESTESTNCPKFPTEMLPDLLKRYAKAVSEELQVSADMPSVSLLTTLALCTQRKFEVQPKSGWREPINLYAAIIAEPSERKSAVQARIMQAVHLFADEENERRSPQVSEYKSKCVILKKKIESLSKAVAEGKQPKNVSGPVDVELHNVTKELTDLQNHPVDFLTLVADDITPEALSDTMAVNGEKMGIFSTEGGVFQILGGLYSSGSANLDIFLKAFSGDFFQSNRIGRKKVSMQHPALTMLLMFQPTVLSGVMANGEFKGKGLLARFLYSIPTSTVGNRSYNTLPVDPALEHEYQEFIHRVLGISDDDVQIIRFSPEAEAEAEKLFNDIEPKLSDGDLAAIGDWSGKHHGRVMRIAALLHIAEHVEQAANIPVAGETVVRARVIGDYFIAHALTAFRYMGAADDNSTKDAKYILKRLSTVGGSEISKRNLHQLCKGKFKKVDEMSAGLAVLIDRGYIAIRMVSPSQNPQNSQKSKSKGRPSEVVYMNPLIKSNGATDDRSTPSISSEAVESIDRNDNG